MKANSIKTKEKFGGRDRDRTGDPLLAKHETLLQQFHWKL
jgi:hypothetical protein